jgi:hypothetical protein
MAQARTDKSTTTKHIDMHLRPLISYSVNPLRALRIKLYTTLDSGDRTQLDPLLKHQGSVCKSHLGEHTFSASLLLRVPSIPGTAGDGELGGIHVAERTVLRPLAVVGARCSDDLAASPSDRNQCSCGQSSRNSPLKLSTSTFYVGVPT